MQWERGSLLLTALPETTEVQKKLWGFFVFCTALALSFTKLVQGDLLLATGTEGWPGACLQKMRQGVPTAKCRTLVIRR